MPDLTTDHPSLLLPEQVGELVVQPVDRASIAVEVSTVVTTASGNFRVPIVDTDVAAGWVEEGDEIPETSAGTDELLVTPRKLAALTVISRELATDSSPAAQAVVGESIARDLARRLDVAYFGAAVGAAPDGLGDLTGFGAITGGAAWTNLDVFAEAIYAADAEGREVTAFVANSADALTLSTLKDDSGSNRPLLGDPIDGTRRRILGVPLYVSPAVAAGTVWAIPSAVSLVVRRSDVDLAVDSSRYFERDSIAVRATMRVAFAFPHAAAIQRIALATT